MFSFSPWLGNFLLFPITMLLMRKQKERDWGESIVTQLWQAFLWSPWSNLKLSFMPQNDICKMGEIVAYLIGLRMQEANIILLKINKNAI